MLYVVLGTIALVAGIVGLLRNRRPTGTMPVPAGAASPNNAVALLSTPE